MPLVFDLAERRMHWLDVHATGQLSMNNVATSNRSIQKICPDLMAYFGSGARASMYELAALARRERAARVRRATRSQPRSVRRPRFDQSL